MLIARPRQPRACWSTPTSATRSCWPCWPGCYPLRADPDPGYRPAGQRLHGGVQRRRLPRRQAGEPAGPGLAARQAGVPDLLGRLDRRHRGRRPPVGRRATGACAWSAASSAAASPPASTACATSPPARSSSSPTCASRSTPAPCGRWSSGWPIPRVGCVSGNLVLRGAAGSGAYWRYEKFIRRKEATFRSVVGMTGSIAVIRKADLPPAAARPHPGRRLDPDAPAAARAGSSCSPRTPWPSTSPSTTTASSAARCARWPATTSCSPGCPALLSPLLQPLLVRDRLAQAAAPGVPLGAGRAGAGLRGRPGRCERPRRRAHAWPPACWRPRACSTCWPRSARAPAGWAAWPAPSW